MRVVLGIAYRGSAYSGWQSQPGGRTVQDHVDAAISAFADAPLKSICAGRTDAGVHALNQVVHFDTDAVRAVDGWMRGCNRYLPPDIAVQWCRFMPASFHSRASALGRRYDYLLLESPVRPAIETGLAGWTFRALDGDAMRLAAQALLGTHDFSAFRSAECQAPSPVKTMHEMAIERRGAYWRFRFDADAFLHHMIRNVVGCLVAVGSGARTPLWLADVLAGRDRSLAAATFAPDGLYFLGPYYDATHGIPDKTPAMDWLP
ncbi:MAG: tRNA pseudouridine(38-40) synthase TruA [Caldimonas sp.]